MRRLISLSFLAALAILMPAQAADACPTPGHGHRGLFLTVSAGDSPGHDRTATLSCGPAHGDHPKAKEACRALQAVGGDPANFADHPFQTMACTLQYQPVTVTANGVWDEAPVKFTKTYGNDCALTAATGPVFNFG